jgi:hypothetical protein
VIGRDGEAVRRRGNISGTGFFFECDGWPGRPGDISVMEIWSEDQTHSFTTMASLVRVVRPEDTRWSTASQGASFQFHPSDEATRTAIARTVRHIAEQHPEQTGELRLDEFQDAVTEELYKGVGEDAMPAIEAGGQVRIVVENMAGGARKEVIGTVGDITESVQDGATRYWVPVYVEAGVEPEIVQPEGAGGEQEETAPVAAEPMARAEADAARPEESGQGDSLIDSMWKELVPEARSLITDADAELDPDGQSPLSGKLSQITMPSALWLLDQERLSGVLEFRREGEKIVLYLSEGRVIDAESPDLARTPREHLRALMRWQDGEFAFRVEEVNREDRLGVPTQGLLLDLAVENDHQGF